MIQVPGAVGRPRPGGDEALLVHIGSSAASNAKYESDVGVRLHNTPKPPGGTWNSKLFSPVTGEAIVIWVCDAKTAPLMNTVDESPLAVTIVLGPFVIL
jgi:hypothetical protein